MSCIFCKIVEKEIPANIVYEDENVLAFHDIQPKAPIHILLIPKIHIENILNMPLNNATLAATVLSGIQKVATAFNLEESGFRVVTNTGDDGGQTVGHLHFHILGGRPLSWPPG